MSHDLTSVKIAALVGQGFEEDQLLESQEFLHHAGATVTIVSTASGDLPKTGKAGKPLAAINVETAPGSTRCFCRAGRPVRIIFVGPRRQLNLSAPSSLLRSQLPRWPMPSRYWQQSMESLAAG